MRETIVLPERSVALDDRSVRFGQRRGQLRLQRIDVGQGQFAAALTPERESDLLTVVEINHPLEAAL